MAALTFPAALAQTEITPGAIVVAAVAGTYGKVVSEGLRGRVLAVGPSRNPYSTEPCADIFWFGGVGYGSGWRLSDLRRVA